MQHAHQKGIIHRDIKPSNVMIAEYDGRPVPKVIDFGVAKAIEQQLTEKTAFTGFGQVVGTLEYMSPEQATLSQLDIDTRSDIYSLGVLLYELLTGETPFDRERLRSSPFDETLRIIREEELTRPSDRVTALRCACTTKCPHCHGQPRDLIRTLRGDLDWIVMKALEKDRGRRYETAGSFCDDIERYLSDEPVQACPPSAAYRFKKFVRRNKGVLSTILLVAATLIAGTAVSTWQAIRATRAETLASQRLIAERLAHKEADRERDRANNEAVVAQAVNDFLNEDLLSQADAENEPDREIKLRTVVDRAAEKIGDRFADQPLVEAAIRDTLGRTYSSLGEYEKADDQYELAYEIRKRELGDEHSSTLESALNLAGAIGRQGRYAEAERLERNVLAIAHRQLSSEHRVTLGAMHNLAFTIASQGRYAEAETRYREVLQTARQVFGPEHFYTLGTMNNLANAISRQGRYAEAEKRHREVLEMRRRILGAEHPGTLDTMKNLANTIGDDRHADAEKIYREVLEIRRRVLGLEHPRTLATMDALAVRMAKQGQVAEAEELLRKVVEIQTRVLGAEHPATLHSMHNLACFISCLGWHIAAETLLNNVLEVRRRVLGPEHPETLQSWHLLFLTIHRQKRYTEGEHLLRELVDIQQRVLGREHRSTLNNLNALGVVINNQGRTEEAEKLHREVLEIQQRVLGPEDPDTLWSQHNLAVTLRCQKRFGEAVYIDRQVFQARNRMLGPEHPDTCKSRKSLIADGINGSWSLATASDPAKRDPQMAVELARTAVELAAKDANAWDNLGIALYRAGDYQGAVEMLEKAREMRGGKDPVHQFFLAMTYWQLGREEEATREYAAAAAWLQEKKRSADQSRFCEEAEQLMGVSPADRRTEPPRPSDQGRSAGSGA